MKVTGDAAVLDELVPWLEGPVLRDGEHDAFFEPGMSEDKASLFEHCALALDRSLAMGAHGLPLMGTGDWNDGMDRVGEGGKGESVWLGWFLYAALTPFAAIAEKRGATEQAAEWRQAAAALKAALEREAWDGDWYRRAFYDDGYTLGSVSNNECRIDSIAQSWAVISRAAEPSRAARAMEALNKYLVRRDDKLSLLFQPPFNQPSHDPGYIKGYPPGIRENGGQYTHAASWAAIAFAMQGDGDRAGELIAMLNPIHHADSPTGVHRYRVEPYVACADVYSMPPHAGRGGWTWYTGSAGWIWRAAVEWLLGLRVQGENLVLDPCIPHGWPEFEIVFRYRSSRYEIAVEKSLERVPRHPRRQARRQDAVRREDLHRPARRRRQDAPASRDTRLSAIVGAAIAALLFRLRISGETMRHPIRLCAACAAILLVVCAAQAAPQNPGLTAHVGEGDDSTEPSKALAISHLVASTSRSQATRRTPC